MQHRINAIENVRKMTQFVFVSHIKDFKRYLNLIFMRWGGDRAKKSNYPRVITPYFFEDCGGV